MRVTVLVATSLALASAYLNHEGGYCDGLECASREQLLEEVQKYKDQLDLERSAGHMVNNNYNYKQQKLAVYGTTSNPFSYTNPTATPSLPTCNICASTPCLNGGTCLADPAAPWTNYTCVCLDNYAGDVCQEKLSCNPFPCGQNADCSVRNHQINCVCEKGFAGDPWKGCAQSMRRSCLNSDPHITTFDGLAIDYQGTCPYIFSQPCTTLGNGYSDYVIKAKNEKYSSTGHVSHFTEAEITFYNQSIHVDTRSSRVYFNNLEITVPFYWPSASNPMITVTMAGRTFYVSNNEFISAEATYSQLCVQVPYVPNVTVGKYALCGLNGNIDGDWKDDLAYRNGTTFPVTKKSYFLDLNNVELNRAEDSWMTTFQLQVDTNQDKCLSAESMGNITTSCDSDQSAGLCYPIKQAINGSGPFAECGIMGAELINNWYQDCVVTLCSQPQEKCQEFKEFVSTCMTYLPQDTDQGPWRDETACPMLCPLNSHYSSCKSSCPNSCADHDQTHCDLGCSEGCSCDPGYVVDNTHLSQTTCIKVGECGCKDSNGNSHSANTPWLTNQCSTWNDCTNGTYVVKNNTCGANAACSSSGGVMHCQCNPGYQGDGYTCEDIDECLNNSTCHRGEGHGTCTNTPGSYNCTCNPYYSTPHCAQYLPARQCADLLIYHGLTQSGIYTIFPPKIGSPFGEPVQVECDMTTDGGGWTLMSTAEKSEFSGKTYSEYEAGFGNPANGSAWLGLDNIYRMTHSHNNSLRIHIERCANFGFSQNAYVEYKYFYVNSAANNYTVVIPEHCTGNDTSGLDGWARWSLNRPGPKFVTYDRDDSEQCSALTRNTGFWFDTSNPFARCGAANFNGARPRCDGSVSPYDTSYISYNGYAISQAAMYLRPTEFPNYDSHASSFGTTLQYTATTPSGTGTTTYY